MKNNNKIKALVLLTIITLGIAMPMMAQSDGFFKSEEGLYGNRATASGNITNQTFGQDPGTIVSGGITNQQFGAPLGSGLLIMVAAGAGYAIARRKRARKGMTLLLAAAMLLGMTQCKKRIDTVNQISGNQGGVHITLTINNDSKHHIVTTGQAWPNGDLGKVMFDAGDEIFVVNGGKIIGTLECKVSGESGYFEGEIGFDLLNNNAPVEIKTDDYLHFGFFGNAEPQMHGSDIAVYIGAQKNSMPVISCGHTQNYYVEGQTDYTCELENKCALAKFTIEDLDEVSLSGDDEVCVYGMQTYVKLVISETGIQMLPYTGTDTEGGISLYWPGGETPTNERWAILLPQQEVTGKSMFIRNLKYAGVVDVDAVSNNQLLDVTISCDGVTPEPMYYFTVMQGKKVQIAPGNLQYQASTSTFRFAEHQYDFVGGTTSGDTPTTCGNVYENNVKCNNMLIGDSYTGWIDLFGWGTGSNPTETSPDNEDYENFDDWGGHIGDNNWRTLNVLEYLCLLGYFDNDMMTGTLEALGYVDYIRYQKSGPCTITENPSRDGDQPAVVAYGMVILPDYWTPPTGCSFNYGETNFITDPSDPEYFTLEGNWNEYDLNVYTKDQWSAMETAGAVFLPSAGYRECGYTESDPTVPVHRFIDTHDETMLYWSINPYYGAHPANVLVAGSSIGLYHEEEGRMGASTGVSVRLVKDIQ